MTARRAPIAAALSAAILVAGCGAGGPSSSHPGSTTGAPGASSPLSAASVAPGRSPGLGYDCATLLTPSELDAAAGLTGGTVTTTRRGDQPADGEVLGVTECEIDVPSAGLWHGNIHVLVGHDALENFNAAFDFAKGQGAEALAGVGTEALIESTEVGVTGYARGANGVGVQVGVGWDEDSTTEAKVKEAVRQILITVLSRT